MQEGKIFSSGDSPGNRFVASAAPSSAEGMPRTRTSGTGQSRRTLRDMCPTIGWCSAAAARVSADCSSSEMRIASSRRHVPVDDDVSSLKTQITIYYHHSAIVGCMSNWLI